MCQRVYASGEEARAIGTVLEVSGGSGECAGVHVLMRPKE
jgi:hypothetical protein